MPTSKTRSGVAPESATRAEIRPLLLAASLTLGAMIDAVAHIRAEADRFAAVLAGVALDARVPSCPDWNAAELLSHLAGVHQFWAGVLAHGFTQTSDVQAWDEQRPRLPESIAELLSVRKASTEALVAELASRDDAEPAWSWFPADQTVGFTRRMQTHEVTMHRVDAELTAGLPVSGIAADIAAAGIDHVLDVMWNWVPQSAQCRETGVLELRATDTGQRWLVRTLRWSGQAWGTQFVDQSAALRATDASVPTASVRAPIAELDLLVWGRPATVERSGRAEVLDEFDAAVAEGHN